MLKAPIGVFDSGFGGVSVLRDAIKLFPNESYIYYSDNGNAPYGEREEDDITSLSLTCAKYLKSRGVKAIVVACNTATTVCLPALAQACGVPTIGIHPAIEVASGVTGNGKIAVMATLATTRAERYQQLIQASPCASRIISIPCVGLAARIEQGIFGDDEFDDLLSSYYYSLQDVQFDTIVLGCTHYNFIKGAIKKYANKHLHGPCTLISTNDATLNELADALGYKQSVPSSAALPSIEFVTSGDYNRLKPIFDRLLQS